MASVGEQIIDLVTGRLSKAEAALIKLRALYAASLHEVENLGADLRVVREQLVVEHNARVSGMPPAPALERLANLDVGPIMALHAKREAKRNGSPRPHRPTEKGRRAESAHPARRPAKPKRKR